MSDLPILYSFRRCPYAMRARLALFVSDTPVQLREIVLKDKAPEFLAVSPSASVPCLVDTGGTVIDESLDVMVWALRKSDPDGWLSPEAGSLSDGLTLAARLDGDFKRHLDRYKYGTRYPDARREDERAAASAILMELEERLVRHGWLFGSRASLADYAFLPFLRQFANVDRSWFDDQPWPHLLKALRDFETSSRFAAIMPKYAKWQAGDRPVVFP